MNRDTLLLLLKIAGFGITIFLGMLYYVLRTKVNNVSSEKPFNSILNQKLTTKRVSFLVKNRTPEVNENDYLLVENKDEINLELKEIYEIPVNTNFILQKAKIFTNGTSGFSYSYVLGTIYIDDLKKEVAFEYNYGEKKIFLYGEEKEYWFFDKSIWDDEKIEGKFYFD